MRWKGYEARSLIGTYPGDTLASSTAVDVGLVTGVAARSDGLLVLVGDVGVVVPGDLDGLSLGVDFDGFGFGLELFSGLRTVFLLVVLDPLLEKVMRYLNIFFGATAGQRANLLTL